MSTLILSTWRVSEPPQNRPPSNNEPPPSPRVVQSVISPSASALRTAEAGVIVGLALHAVAGVEAGAAQEDAANNGGGAGFGYIYD